MMSFGVFVEVLPARKPARKRDQQLSRAKA